MPNDVYNVVKDAYTDGSTPVDVILGPGYSSSVIRAQHYLITKNSAKKVPLLSYMASSPMLLTESAVSSISLPAASTSARGSSIYPNFFGLHPNDAGVMEATARLFVRVFGWKAVHILFEP